MVPRIEGEEMKGKFWYIKERHNPQLEIYYVPLGNISQKEAKKHEKTPYGYNVILRFDTKEEYLKKLNVQGIK
jgi:hypothetical protein